MVPMVPMELRVLMVLTVRLGRLVRKGLLV
jgi:hypothetical protein